MGGNVIDRKSRALSALYSVIAAYGFIFGTPMMIGGLFSGWHIVVPGMLQVLFGIGFAAAASGVEKSIRTAYQIGAALSSAVTILSFIVFVQATRDHDLGSFYFWGIMLTFFATVTLITLIIWRLSYYPNSSPTSRKELPHQVMKPKGIP